MPIVNTAKTERLLAGACVRTGRGRSRSVWRQARGPAMHACGATAPRIAGRAGQDGLPRLAGGAGSAAEQGLLADPAPAAERRAPGHRVSSFAMARRRRKGRRFLVTFCRCWQKVTRL